MRQIIHNLRQKSDYHKKGVALAASGGFTLLLVVIWAITFPVRYGSLFSNQNNDQSASALTASPIDSLRASLNSTSTLQTTSSDGVSISDNGASYSPVQSQPAAIPVVNSSQQNGVTISDTDTTTESASTQSGSSMSPFTSQ